MADGTAPVDEDSCFDEMHGQRLHLQRVLGRMLAHLGPLEREVLVKDFIARSEAAPDTMDQCTGDDLLALVMSGGR